MILNGTLQSSNEDHISNDLKPKAYLWFRVLEHWNILFKILIQNHHLGPLFVSDEPRSILEKIWTLHSKPDPISKTEIPLYWKLHRIHFGPYDPKFTGGRCALPQRGISAQSTVGTRSWDIVNCRSRTLGTLQNPDRNHNFSIKYIMKQFLTKIAFQGLFIERCCKR